MNHLVRSLIALVLLLSSIVVAAPAAGLLSPSADPFYSPPEGFESAAVGTILKSRVTPQPVRSIYVTINIKNAWQLLVRSEDSFGNATAIVTTILEPYNADPSKLLSYQFFEDAANLNCSISYALQVDAPVIPVIQTEFEMYFLDAALEQGWYVVAPDYEGPKSAFTAGRQAGHAVLDSIRATLQSNSITGVNSDAKVALWGYSGGSLASGWAAALQPAYAPELSSSLIGAAVGGFVTNITATAIAVDGQAFTGLIPLAINGLAQEYPEVLPIVEAQMTPANYESFLQGNQLCMVPGALNYLGKNFFSGTNKYFEDGQAFFQNPTVANIVEQNTLAINPDAEVPQIPLFIYQGVIDAVVPAVGAERAYTNWCAWGSPSIELALDSTNGHVTETFIGAPAALTWLMERFEGKAPVKGCSKTTRVSNLSYPNTPVSLIIYFQSALTSLAQLPIGPLAQDLPAL